VDQIFYDADAMKTRLRQLLIVLLSQGALCHAQETATISLTVIEKGFASLLAADEKGTEYEFKTVKRTTRYEPVDWQVAEGDQVMIEYIPAGENQVEQTCVLVRLEKPGVKSMAMANPLEGRVAEISRSSIIVEKKVEHDSVTYKFFLGRQTRFVPSDWKPLAGDLVIISYSNRPTKALGYILTVDQIQKVE